MMRSLVACGVVVIAAIAWWPVTGIAAPPTVACSLLTTAEVTAALGTAVGAGRQSTKQDCQWWQEGKGGDLLKLDVRLTTIETYNKFKTDKSVTITSVSGIGDDAYYATQTGNDIQAVLCVRKGETAAIIHAFGGKKSVAEYQSMERAIAAALLPGL